MQYIMMGVAVAILLLSAGIGYRKGLMKTALGMLGLVLAVLAVWLLHPVVEGVIDEYTSLYEMTQDAVAQMLMEEMEEAKAKTQAEKEEVAETFLPAFLSESVMADLGENATTSDFVEGVSRAAAGLVVSLVAALATFVVAFVLIRVLISFSGIFNWIPGIREINRLGGGLLGLLRGVVILWLLCFVVAMLTPMAMGQSLLKAIEENALLSAFYQGAFSFRALLRLGLSMG